MIVVSHSALFDGADEPVWWRRWHDDSDAELDNTHLMRLAGRFARRVKAWGAANQVPVMFCKAGQRKHRIAEQYLATHEVGVGVFLVLVAKAPAPVWKVTRSAAGRIVNIERRIEYVNHYSFHIIDPQWGHVTIKMSGHPPFGAQIILNGHEYVARQAQAAGIAFSKAGDCFTAVADPAGLARIADALSQDAAVGRLSQVCQRWIYTACLCFGLDLDEQHKSGFGYGFAVYQLEYSRNLIFADGHRMQQLFDAVVDRTRSRLDVPRIRTIFGAAQRPRRTRKQSSTIEAAIETPTYDLTVFKLHFGRLTGKAYTKGERVLRFEAVVHNTAELRCGRMIDKFPEIVTQLAGIAERFATALDCVDTGFLGDGILDELPAGSTLGATRIGGVDLNTKRMHDALSAVLALAPAPHGFTVGEFAAKVHAITGACDADYSVRQAAHDLRKLRGKQLVDKPARTRRYLARDSIHEGQRDVPHRCLACGPPYCQRGGRGPVDTDYDSQVFAATRHFAVLPDWMPGMTGRDVADARGSLVAETLTLEQSFGDVYGGGCPLQFLQTVGLTSHFGWHGRSLR